jgi:two-component system OmpR family sensor kinase/two-component system sensor histidine kinase QseC
MNSIRTRLLIALILLVALVSTLAGTITYRRVLNETSTLFDYQLRQMALSLRSQISLAPRIEVPPDQGDTDFVIQIWDLFGARMYLSRPGLPIINQTVLGYADLSVQGQKWRAFGLQTAAGVIQIAQPISVRERLARAAALRIVVPLIVLLPVMALFVAWIVGRGLQPLQRLTAEVQRRDASSLKPLAADNLPREIEPLVAELNRLLIRLRDAFAVQRDFIADAAHELRSPLTALRLQLQLFDRAPDETAKGEARLRLGEAVERAIHLVEQLLVLARSEPQNVRGELAPMDLTAATALGVADAHVLAQARHIDLSLEAQPNCQIQGDPESIRILVRNLVDNAVRYTPEGGSVRVRCSPQNDARPAANGALLEVSDTGPGIAAAERERIFDRFYRRAASQESGTGLGLAIVKAIAERHGARIVLDAAPGGGLHVAVEFRGNSAGAS